MYTHTKKHDCRTFVDDKAKAVEDAYQELASKRSRDENSTSIEGESQQGVDELAIFLEAAGGEKKRRIYGLGSKALDYYSSVPSPGVAPSISMSQQTESKLSTLEKTVEAHENRIKCLEETIDSQGNLLKEADDLVLTGIKIMEEFSKDIDGLKSTVLEICSRLGSKPPVLDNRDMNSLENFAQRATNFLNAYQPQPKTEPQHESNDSLS